MKKIIALVLVMLLAAMGLSACSGKTLTTVTATDAPAVTEVPVVATEVPATDAPLTATDAPAVIESETSAEPAA